MDSSYRGQGSDDTQRQPSLFLAILEVFDSILHRLAGLIQLTEEEQKDAGIYIGDRRYR